MAEVFGVSADEHKVTNDSVRHSLGRELAGEFRIIVAALIGMVAAIVAMLSFSLFWDDSIASQSVVLATSSAVLLTFTLVIAVIAFIRRRRWQRLLVNPVRHMLEDVRAVGRGDFAVTPVESNIQEILDLSDGLADMATSMRLSQRALKGRAEQANRSADRLRRVLGFAREMSGSLTLPSVLESVGRAAMSLTGTKQCRVWLIGEDGTTPQLCFDTGFTHDAESALRVVAPAGGSVVQAAGFQSFNYVLEAAADLVEDSASYAVPLISSGHAIGVLELAVPNPKARFDAQVLEVLEAVAGHSATAIEAAKLYQQTERLSMSDPLTGLANRRRLDEDLLLEAERAGRYGRSLAFLMIDVDHFKRINDEHGHAEGDVVLQQLAALMTDHMRSVDTAYRYGGEEMAILARETDLMGASRLAERLREGIERHFLAGPVSVTVSIGVATMPSQARTPKELAAAADDALYAAKRSGRNRVELAPDTLLPPSVAKVDELPAQPAIQDRAKH